MRIPEHLKYTRSHEWVRLEGTTATIGISEFAVEQLGDITLVELPNIGESISSGDAMGTIESVKAVSDLCAPLNGVITETNRDLEECPEKVNEDCYDNGWIARLELSEDQEDLELMDSAGYEEYLDSLD